MSVKVEIYTQGERLDCSIFTSRSPHSDGDVKEVVYIFWYLLQSKTIIEHMKLL